MDVQGSYKRVQLIRVSNSDSLAMSLNCCPPKTSLLVSCSSDTAYLIHWDKLLPHQIPPSPSPSPQTLKEKIYIYPTKKKLSASQLLRGWVLSTSNLAKTKKWHVGESANTGESVLQGKVNTPATHLSKDTW